MRNAVKTKLRSQTGASLLIALLFFLVAMMVGAVVLTAAATNAGRLARNRQEQQNYLAVSSAARLVKEDFRDTTFTVGYKGVTTITTTTYTDPVTGKTHTEIDKTGPIYSENPEVLAVSDGKLLTDRPMNDLAQLYYSTVDVLNTSTLGALKYDLKFTAENLPDVSGTMEVATLDGARYTITVKLYDSADTNAMTMVFPATAHSSQATTSEINGNTETITTTYTTTVNWGTPTITKGAMP